MIAEVRDNQQKTGQHSCFLNHTCFQHHHRSAFTAPAATRKPIETQQLVVPFTWRHGYYSPPAEGLGNLIRRLVDARDVIGAQPQLSRLQVDRN